MSILFSEAESVLQKFSNLNDNDVNSFLVQFPTFWCILELTEPPFLDKEFLISKFKYTFSYFLC